ncbi:hypothetical protein CR513_33151, partial [Mucuna pruriens]
MRRTKMHRNVDVGEGSSSTPPTLIFNYLGRTIDLEAAHLYVLLNCEEVLNLENNIEDSLLVDLAWGPKRKLSKIIQLKYIDFPIMKLVLFKCDWFDNTPNIGTKVHNKYEIVEVRESRRYNKAYDSFIFAQQVEQVYYTPYLEGHHSWLATEQEALYQDDDFVGIQVVFHIDLDAINDSLANIDAGGGEEVDR